MSTDPRPRVIEPGDFDPYAVPQPEIDRLTLDDHRRMPPWEKMRLMGIARQNVRRAHRAWYLEQFPDASDDEIWGDWIRVTGCAAILAEARKDEAARVADVPILVDLLR